MLNVNIQRFDPLNDQAPHIENYQVPLDTGVPVLGVLDYVRKNLDETFAYRIFCTNQHCGECGVMLNGKPVLACRDLIESENVTLAPLKGFDIVKDLVVDVESMILKQWIDFPELRGKRVFNDLLTEEEREPIFLAGACIGCAICQAVCPLHKQGSECLSGPAYFAALSQYLIRATTREELDALLKLADEHGLRDCTGCQLCSKRCPKEVDPYRVVTILTSLAKQAETV